MIVGMGMGCQSGKGGKGDKGKPLLHPQQPRGEPATVRSEVAGLRSEVAELRAEVADLRGRLEWFGRALDRQLPLMPMPEAEEEREDGKGLKRQRT